MTQATRRNRRPFGAIRQLRSGRYQAHWTGPDGHKHLAPATYLTEDEAEAWLAKVRVELAAEAYVDERLGAMRLKAFEATWRPTIVHLRRSTLERDLGYVDRYILASVDPDRPALGDLALAELDYIALTAWVSGLRAAGLAPATVVKAAQILGKILDAAVKAGKIRPHALRDVKLPKVEKAELRVLEPFEVDRLAAAIDERYASLVIVAAHTGLRFGELAALTAGDVDLLRRRLTVKRNVVDLGELDLSNVKTAAGRRAVPLDDEAVAALEPLVGGRHPDDLLWEAPRGGFVRLNSWRARFWSPAVAEAGLSGLRIHDLRHTAVSWWLRSGTDPKAVAGWAGHASVVTVLDRYAHELPDHADEHLARLNAYVAASKAAASSPGTVTPLRRRRAGDAPTP